jgi:threonine dehydrogenase-like Zn-dependent dehydrogenase
MKALVYLGPGRMEIQDRPDPMPGTGEALVRVTASAICGSDLHGFRAPSPRRIPPLVKGHEVAGVVERSGADVDRRLEGTRVVAMPVVSCGTCARCLEGAPNLCPSRRLLGMDVPGAFAETFTIPASQLVAIPEGLDDVEACLAEPLANSLHSVRRAVVGGDTVLVIGAGPIGLFAARAAILGGAGRIWVVDPLAGRLRQAARLGADTLAVDDAQASLHRATRGDGVDVVIDAAGFPATWELALQAVRYGGRVEAIGLGAAEGPLTYQTLVAKGVTVAGSYACVRGDFDRALALLHDRDVEVLDWIATMPMVEGQSAFEALVRDDTYTKVVLQP